MIPPVKGWTFGRPTWTFRTPRRQASPTGRKIHSPASSTAASRISSSNNPWQGNLLLVALADSLISDVSNAVGKVTLSLPLADAHPWSLQENLPFISVPLSHQSTRDFACIVEHAITSNGSSIVRTARPLVHSYVQEDLDWGTIDDTAIHLFAQDDGGIVISGATYGRTFWLEGPKEDFRDLLVIDIEPPAGHQAFLLHTQLPIKPHLHSHRSRTRMPPLTWSTRGRSSARILLLGLMLSPGCNDQAPVDDECFSIDPWKDERDAAHEYSMSEEFQLEEYDRMLRAIGFCEYDPDQIGEIFPDYDREDINTWSACIPRTSCEQCVGEDIDTLIRQSYDQYLDSRGCPADHRAILAYERGCVSPELDANGEPECCYSAAMVGECEAGDIPGR